MIRARINGATLTVVERRQATVLIERLAVAFPDAPGLGSLRRLLADAPTAGPCASWEAANYNARLIRRGGCNNPTARGVAESAAPT